MKRLFSILLVALPVHAQPRAGTGILFDEDADRRCGGVEAEWIAELRSRLPEFRTTWESIVPPMSRAVTELTRKAFVPAGNVRLTLCDVPSNSFFGATVNMRYALRSFTAQPAPLRYKADTAFHELLHGFISSNTPSGSSLLAKHASESPCVRNHLHLLALQKAVLVKLGESEALAQVVSIDSQLPSGCYRRAWSLVNQSGSTYLEYIAELAH